jgi:hypothetical protein
MDDTVAALYLRMTVLLGIFGWIHKLTATLNPMKRNYG